MLPVYRTQPSARHPRESRLSSYRANAEGRDNTLLQPDHQYQRLGRSADSRREAYRALFKAHTDHGVWNQIRAATNGNTVLGTPRFQEEIERMLGRRVVKGKAGRPTQKHLGPD